MSTAFALVRGAAEITGYLTWIGMAVIAGYLYFGLRMSMKTR